MLRIRSLLLITNLLVPVLLFGTGILHDDSPAVPFMGMIFATLTGMLIACTTTQTRPFFFRKLITSSALAFGLFLTTFVVFWTWAEEQRFFESDEWSPLGVEVLTGPIRGLAAVMAVLATIGLIWLAAATEVPEPL